jgi:hypothetical protein
MATKQIHACTISIDFKTDIGPGFGEAYGEAGTRDEAIRKALREWQKKNPNSRITKTHPNCRLKTIDVPSPDDVVQEISSNIQEPEDPSNPDKIRKRLVVFRRLRKGLLLYSVWGSAWQTIMWETGTPAGVKDMGYNDFIPASEPFFNTFEFIRFSLIIIGGDDRLLFLSLDLSGDVNRQLKNARSSSWTYFGWPDPNSTASETMHAKSIKSLAWESRGLKVTVTGGDGRTCTTFMNPLVALPGPGDNRTFLSGWSCS